MAYVSLYRKYRPQTFEDVVGQDHISTTLQNAIRKNTVSNGYLFSGTRGTAKTTCARILAKALNCVGPDGTLTAPVATPCGVCVPCMAIASSNFIDVVEMDAASHGKIDDVRDIVGSIMYPPMEGRYKAYIIDEAHQLSRDAMDAFLKTLEEPPPRVVFILATTEVDKLPITIASRCQVFEFRRGSISQISGRLSDVMLSEGASAHEGVVAAIAKAADGSYRDSLSLLEQVLAYKFTDISLKDVSTVLGSIDSETLDSIIEIIVTKNEANAFSLAAEVLNSGKDIRQFLRSLTSRLRELLLLAVGGSIDDNISDMSSASLRSQSSEFNSDALLRMIQSVVQAESETRTNNQHQLILEITLLKLISESRSGSSEKVNRSPSLAGHEKNLAHSPAIEIAKKADNRVSDGPSSGSENEYKYEANTDGTHENNSAPTSDSSAHQQEDLLRVQQVAADYVEPVVGQKFAADMPELLVRLQKSWQSVVNRMNLRSPAGAPLIRDAVPVSLSGSTIMLKLSSPFAVQRMNSNPKGRKVVEDVISKVLEVPEGTFTVKCVLHDPATTSVHMDTAKSEPSQQSLENSVQNNTDNGLLEEVIAVFGGRVVEDE